MLILPGRVNLDVVIDRKLRRHVAIWPYTNIRVTKGKVAHANCRYATALY